MEEGGGPPRGKLVEVFALSRDLLSPQQHYDWGLRPGCGTAVGCTPLAVGKGVGREVPGVGGEWAVVDTGMCMCVLRWGRRDAPGQRPAAGR